VGVWGEASPSTPLPSALSREVASDASVEDPSGLTTGLAGSPAAKHGTHNMRNNKGMGRYRCFLNCNVIRLSVVDVACGVSLAHGYTTPLHQLENEDKIMPALRRVNASAYKDLIKMA
jgi:hypothetical protein